MTRYQVQRKKIKASAKLEDGRCVWEDINMGLIATDREASIRWLKQMRGYHPKQTYRLIILEGA